VTLACRIKPDNTTAWHGGIGIISSPSGGFVSMMNVELDDTGGNAVAGQEDLGGGSNNSGTTVASAITTDWNGLVATFSSTTRCDVYLNGTTGNNTSGATGSAITPGSLDSILIGAYANDDGTFADNVGHNVCECAVWNAVLDVAEISAYMSRVSPLLIRPASLVYYAPLVGRFTTEIDLKGGRGGTVTGATVADHAGVMYPPANVNRRFRTAPAGGTPPPWFSMSNFEMPPRAKVEHIPY
jgi:hypothetical protein